MINKVFFKRIRSLFTFHRLPVLLQMNSTECGAACLAMILQYFGRKTSILECRESFGIGRDGVAIQTIMKVAREYGLRVKAYSVELPQLYQITLPAIIHWNFNHFVVLEKWSPRNATIIDPAHGRLTISRREFSNQFTGIALAFEPGATFDSYRPSFDFKAAYLLQFFRKSTLLGLFVQVISASFLLQLLGLGIPLLTKVLVDDLLPQHKVSAMAILGLGIVVIVLAQVICSYLRSAVLLYLQTQVDSRISLGLFEHLLKLPFAFFQQRTSGDLLMRLGSSAVIRDLLTNQTLSILLDSSFSLFYLIILLSQAPLFGVIVLGIGLLQITLLLITSRRMKNLTQHYLVAQALSQSFAVQVLRGSATLKATASEDLVLDYWSNLFFKELAASLKLKQMSSLMNTAMVSLRTFCSLALLWVGTLLVLSNAMPLGTMLAFDAIGVAFLLPLSSLLDTGQQLQTLGAHLNRITDVIEAQPERILNSSAPSPMLSGHITLKDISFRYDPHSPFVLKDISLEIKPGQKVALVGRTGSGKSTLALLLLGLHNVTTGEILYDGYPLSNLNYSFVRHQYGVVLQEPLLFGATIFQNITLSNPTLTRDEIITAARLAEIHDDIMQMPMGYDTLLSEGGGNLSGGQRQRIALARALAHKPRILLLDEATSHLDGTTESRVDENLTRLLCTRIIIAHRLSTIRNADLIVVLDDGQIVEQGTHEELLAHGTLYAQFVQNQNKTFPESSTI